MICIDISKIAITETESLKIKIAYWILIVILVVLGNISMGFIIETITRR